MNKQHLSEIKCITLSQLKNFICYICGKIMTRGSEDSYGYIHYFCSCGNKKDIPKMDL